jgi:hypothetical protein
MEVRGTASQSQIAHGARRHLHGRTSGGDLLGGLGRRAAVPGSDARRAGDRPHHLVRRRTALSGMTRDRGSLDCAGARPDRPKGSAFSISTDENTVPPLAFRNQPPGTTACSRRRCPTDHGCGRHPTGARDGRTTPGSAIGRTTVRLPRASHQAVGRGPVPGSPDGPGHPAGPGVTAHRVHTALGLCAAHGDRFRSPGPGSACRHDVARARLPGASRGPAEAGLPGTGQRALRSPPPSGTARSPAVIQPTRGGTAGPGPEPFTDRFPFLPPL